MRHISRIAAVSILALAAAACGGPEAEEDVDAIEAEAAAEVGADGEEGAEAAGEGAGEAAEGGEAGADGEEPAPEASATATPTPTPTPTQAAAPAGPPQAFTQCQVCHQVAPGQHGIGPSLAGVFGSRAGQKAGFSYTEGMRSSNLTWNQANLDRYLADPSGTVPGTTMAVGSLTVAQRTAIIDYLKTL